MNPEQLAQIIVEEIIGDLTSRSGLQNAWDDVDEDVRADIYTAWKAIVTEILVA